MLPIHRTTIIIWHPSTVFASSSLLILRTFPDLQPTQRLNLNNYGKLGGQLRLRDDSCLSTTASYRWAQDTRWKGWPNGPNICLQLPAAQRVLCGLPQSWQGARRFQRSNCQRVSTSPSFSDVSQQLQSPSSPASDTPLQCGHPGVEPKLRCMRYVHPHQNPVPETSAHMHRRETETIAVLVDKLLCCYGTPKAQGPIKQVVKCLARLDGNRSLG